MIYFKSLSGNNIRYTKKFNLLLVHEDEKPELMHKYYAEKGDFACVAVFLRIGKTPVWSVASYGELWDTTIPKNFNRLPLGRKAELLNHFTEMNDEELECLTTYVQYRIIPWVKIYCATLDPAVNHIIDIRKTFANEISELGFINMDMITNLENGVMLR